MHFDERDAVHSEWGLKVESWRHGRFQRFTETLNNADGLGGHGIDRRPAGPGQKSEQDNATEDTWIESRQIDLNGGWIRGWHEEKTQLRPPDHGNAEKPSEMDGPL